MPEILFEKSRPSLHQIPWDLTYLYADRPNNEWIERRSKTAGIVTEPKVFPHDIQKLKDGEVIGVYRDHAWRGTAPPYFKIWPHYRGIRPKGTELRGKPYPEKDDAA